MSAPPLVSVVTIFLNAERYLEEAIGSVLAQSYAHWELLLVDDGSTDGSTRIAQQFAARYPERIRYLEHERHANRGMSASRNAGLRAARGSLIAFLDGDDVWRPEKLERQATILGREPRAAMVYGATEHWYSWTGRPEDQSRDVRRRLGVPPDALVEPPALVEAFLSGVAQTPGTCGMLVRREAIEAIGGFDDRFRGMFEDWVFIVKLCLRYPVFVESGSWDRYRQHPESHSSLARARGSYAAWRPNPDEGNFLRWLEQYARDEQVDGGVRGAISRAMRPYRNPVVYRWRVARYWMRIGPVWLWRNAVARVHRLRGHGRSVVRSARREAGP